MVSKYMDSKVFQLDTEVNMIKKDFVCSRCGSNGVYFDATATWSREKQEFILITTLDNTTCDDCDGECKAKEITVSDDD